MNPILIDRRERQAADTRRQDDIYHELTIRRRTIDLPIERVELEFGDCVFDGNGPAGLCTVGIERKKLSDVYTAMRERRLSGRQLQGMWSHYDFVFVFIEETWRPGPADGVEISANGGRHWYAAKVGGQYMSYKAIAHYLTTLELKGNVIVRLTNDVRETAEAYLNLWHWFNDKRWDQHTSHDTTYVKSPQAPRGGKVGFVRRSLSPAFLFACTLPGIDEGKAKAVARHFKSVDAMVNCGDVKEWMKVPGVGKILAKAALERIRAEYDDYQY